MAKEMSDIINEMFYRQMAVNSNMRPLTTYQYQGLANLGSPTEIKMPEFKGVTSKQVKDLETIADAIVKDQKDKENKVIGDKARENGFEFTPPKLKLPPKKDQPIGGGLPMDEIDNESLDIPPIFYQRQLQKKQSPTLKVKTK